MKNGLGNTYLFVFQLHGQGSCRGDSGGPLLIFHDDPTDRYFIQVAVVSGGKDYRCHGTAPGIYTRLDDPEVLNWILKVAFRRSFGHKILVATGYPQDIGQKTAIIDVISGEYCRLPDFPISLTGGIGGILGGITMSCGEVEVVRS